MLQFLSFKTAATSKGCCSVPVSRQVQHQKDVAVSQFQDSCNIKRMLQCPRFKTGATSKGCCSLPVLRQVQHQKDVAVSQFQDSCNIKRMLQCPSFKTGATSKGCCSFPFSRHLQHQKDVAVSRFHSAVTSRVVIVNREAPKEQWHNACAVKTWILAHNFVLSKKKLKII